MTCWGACALSAFAFLCLLLNNILTILFHHRSPSHTLTVSTPHQQNPRETLTGSVQTPTASDLFAERAESRLVHLEGSVKRLQEEIEELRISTSKSKEHKETPATSSTLSPMPSVRPPSETKERRERPKAPPSASVSEAPPEPALLPKEDPSPPKPKPLQVDTASSDESVVSLQATKGLSGDAPDRYIPLFWVNLGTDTKRREYFEVNQAPWLKEAGFSPERTAAFPVFEPELHDPLEFNTTLSLDCRDPSEHSGMVKGFCEDQMDKHPDLVRIEIQVGRGDPDKKKAGDCAVYSEKGRTGNTAAMISHLLGFRTAFLRGADMLVQAEDDADFQFLQTIAEAAKTAVSSVTGKEGKIEKPHHPLDSPLGIMESSLELADGMRRSVLNGIDKSHGWGTNYVGADAWFVEKAASLQAEFLQKKKVAVGVQLHCRSWRKYWNKQQVQDLRGCKCKETKKGNKVPPLMDLSKTDSVLQMRGHKTWESDNLRGHFFGAAGVVWNRDAIEFITRLYFDVEKLKEGVTSIRLPHRSPEDVHSCYPSQLLLSLPKDPKIAVMANPSVPLSGVNEEMDFISSRLGGNVKKKETVDMKLFSSIVEGFSKHLTDGCVFCKDTKVII
uniref:Uncharacterized protein n=1 Tax=Chromera velia CCMP2878 TaxID=1169474 RepID=A0A0G4GIP0_9ALVE|eukprot:Cvel_22015.t1-p1 / transcript=Cvel_22015.t1 / gene=Cvel_22015 / organism=Chromera_velia_CCMP2878 / gene_product=hypothetical protein / transcript_product=hypothetical protein / location=Cvel_scaffold2123:20621-22462(+) / protein_length=614 / sequence_SO=supercontig / SO=protein_coding / is_pseudo=false